MHPRGAYYLIRVLSDFRADLLAQDVYRDQLSITLETPIGPPVTAWRVFHRRTYLVNGTRCVFAHNRAVSTDLGFVTVVRRAQFLTWTQHAPFHQLTKWDTWFSAFGNADFKRSAVKFADIAQTFLGDVAVCVFTLNTDKVAPQQISGTGTTRFTFAFPQKSTRVSGTFVLIKTTTTRCT